MLLDEGMKGTDWARNASVIDYSDTTSKFVDGEENDCEAAN